MKSSFEDKLKNIIGGQKTYVDQEILWAGIAEGITPKKRKKGILLWWGLVITIAILMIGFFRYFSEDPGSNKSSEESKIVLIDAELSKGKTESQEKLVPSVESTKRTENERNREGTKQLDKENIEEIKVREAFNKGILYSENNANDVKTTKDATISWLNSKYSDVDHRMNQNEERQSIDTYVVKSMNNKTVDETGLPMILTKLLEWKIIPLEVNLSELTIKEKEEKSNQDFSIWKIEYFIGQGTILNPSIPQYLSSLEHMELSFYIPVFQSKIWNVNTGLQMTNFVDRFEFDGDYILTENEDVLTEVLIDKNALVQNIYNNQSIETIVEQYVRMYERRMAIGIPIQMEWNKKRKQWSSRFALQFANSAVLPTSYWSINENGAPIREDIGMDWLNPSLGFSLGVERKISQNMYLGIGLQHNQWWFGKGDWLHHKMNNGVVISMTKRFD